MKKNKIPEVYELTGAAMAYGEACGKYGSGSRQAEDAYKKFQKIYDYGRAWRLEPLKP